MGLRHPKKRIVVGLSGGVDSALSALLLKKAGHEVVGVFMKNWEEEHRNCNIKEDVLDAIAVADVIGIDIHIVNFAKEYKEKVFSYFLAEYAKGRTPNPDILCNAEIKFKVFLEHALHLGAEAIATGHYARVENNKNYQLLKGIDPLKDQSYFLYRLTQEQLKYAIFPLGNYHKKTVRRLAMDAHLPVAQKKDSVGICFIGKRPFRTFLKQYLPVEAGLMVNPEGKIVGKHMGLMYYTIGQRKGLDIGGEGKAWYVANKDVPTNRLLVVQGHDHPFLLKSCLSLSSVHWIEKPPVQGSYHVKIRYQTKDAACFLQKTNRQWLLTFEEPQWAVTPGQSAVIYEGALCLGGGIIETADQSQ